MKKLRISRERLKIDKTLLTFFMTIMIIFLAGFLGVLTGFHILIKPNLEMSASTTTTTTTSTLPVTTSTTTTTVVTTSTTTVTATQPCSPCFDYFKYVGHNEQFFSLKNGPRSVKITGVSQTKGGSMDTDTRLDYAYPDQLIVFSGGFPAETEITIDYIDITSDTANRDSATLH